MSAALQVYEFEGHQVPIVMYRGEPTWPARDVGRAMGYEGSGDRFVQAITHDWSEEIEEGFGYHRAEPAKSAGSDVCRSGGRSPILLTEPGIYLACLLSKKPAGRRLRRWLATEVLPALRRGEVVGGGVEARLARLEAQIAEALRLLGGSTEQLALPLLAGSPAPRTPRPGSADVQLHRPAPGADPWLPAVQAAIEGAQQTTIPMVLLAMGQRKADRAASLRVGRLLRHLGWVSPLGHGERVHGAPHHGQTARVWRPLVQA